jgi:hypothetical protein
VVKAPTYGFVLLLLFSYANVRSQESFPTESVFKKPTTAAWLNSYWNVRFSEKFFWAAEVHYRMSETPNVPFVGRVGQLYNRHGIKYMFSKKLNITAGFVLRMNFNPEPGNDAFETMVLEPRLWHEYLFGMPFQYAGVDFVAYHRLRFEHRWSRSNLKDAEYIYRNRYRYKFMLKVPLNSKKLTPGTIYFNPDVELILHSGKTIVANPVEDLRIYPNFGYIFSPRFSGSMGMMYTTGQADMFGYSYKQNWIWKFNIYVSIDARKFEQKIPEINYED